MITTSFSLLLCFVSLFVTLFFSNQLFKHGRYQDSLCIYFTSSVSVYKHLLGPQRHTEGHILQACVFCGAP